MKTKIANILNRRGHSVHDIQVGKPVSEVVAMMARFGIGSVLIRQGDDYIGILSERDLARRCLRADVDITRTPVESVMTAPIAFISADATVEDALKLMSDTDRRYLPVFDDDKLVGIVSQSDLSRWLTRELEAQVTYLESYIRGV